MNRSFPALAFAAVAVTFAPRAALAQEAPPPASPPPALAPQALPPLAQPVFAPGSPPPSTGLGLLIAGSVFTGIGALNLITAPICKTGLIPQASTQNLCLAASLVLGGVTLVIGVPMLAVGASKRSKYKEWKQSQGVVARLTELGVAPVPGGATATWQTAF